MSGRRPMPARIAWRWILLGLTLFWATVTLLAFG